MSQSILETAAKTIGPHLLSKALTKHEQAGLKYLWEAWARPEQLPPESDWRYWIVLAGRGFGKTRCGAEWVRHQVETGKARRLALIAPTAADARDVLVEGESGLLAVCPPWSRPHYEPSKRRITWPNGAVATTFSADEPDRLRGPQFDAGWCDELAVWRYPDAWDQFLFGLRLGKDPQAVITTTPRPRAFLRELVRDPLAAVVSGSTYENRKNLASAFIEQILKKYEGTTLGQQEIHAQLLDEVPGALWTRKGIEADRVKKAPELSRVVVGVDPATTSTESADETGIVVAGVDEDDHGYVLADLSKRATPADWARTAVDAWRTFKATRIVAEKNQGGEMVRHTLRTIDAQVPVELVHASKGKLARAEPIASLCEQHRVHHVGVFADLEDQMCNFSGPGSGVGADRMDAYVWALTDLMLGPRSSYDIKLGGGTRECPWRI